MCFRQRRSRGFWGINWKVVGPASWLLWRSLRGTELHWCNVSLVVQVCAGRDCGILWYLTREKPLGFLSCTIGHSSCEGKVAELVSELDFQGSWAVVSTSTNQDDVFVLPLDVEVVCDVFAGRGAATLLVRLLARASGSEGDDLVESSQRRPCYFFTTEAVCLYGLRGAACVQRSLYSFELCSYAAGANSSRLDTS
jgi:hypothetical protein